MPIELRDNILTSEPIIRSDALTAFALGCVFCIAALVWFLSSLSLNSALCASISRICLSLCAHFVYLRIVSSAYSFASLSILAASVLAFWSMRSLELSSFSVFSRNSFLRADISFLFSDACLRSFSSSSLVCSRLLITSSNCCASEDTWSLASSIISSESPSLPDIANALLLPGTPIKRRYVGRSVATSNSQQAFSTPGVCKA